MLIFSSAVEYGHVQALLETCLFRAKRHLMGWGPDLPLLLEYSQEHGEEVKRSLCHAEVVLRVLDILEEDAPALREYAMSLLRTLARRLLSEAEGRATQEGRRHE